MSHPSEYQLLVEIGRGEWTAVSIGKRPPDAQLVAVKYLTDAGRQDPEQVHRLRDTLRFLAGLPDYDHVVRPLDYIPDAGWFVLELLSGNLADHFRLLAAPLSPDHVRGVLRDALSGLRVLHAAGRWHGSLKPSNLLIDDRGRIKLADSPGLLQNGF